MALFVFLHCNNVACLLLVSCLDLKCFFCFLWHLMGGNSVCWWHIRWIWAACGSLTTCFICLAVALELSIFFASCLTLLAGNLFRSILLSLIGFKANYWSLRKNINISLCRILAVSYGYVTNTTHACTALYHSSTLLSPFLKLVSKSNLVLISLDWGLQNSSNFPHITCRVSSSFGKIPRHILVMPKMPIPGNHFLAFSSLCKHCKLTL